MEELRQKQLPILEKRASELKSDVIAAKLPRRVMTRTPRKSTNPKPSTSKNPTPKEKNESSFEVEKIVTHTVIKGQRKYLVRWKHYNSDDDSWVWEHDLKCPKNLKKYSETCGTECDSDE